MPTLTAEYLDDLARIKLEAADLDPGVIYSIERSTDGGTSWVTVRGATNITDGGVTVVYDYEYAPNIENLYRITAPVISDTFERTAGPAGLVLDGSVNAEVTTPDSPSLYVANELDVRMELQLDDYMTGDLVWLMGQYDGTSDERSWLVRIGSANDLQLLLSSNGTDVATATTGTSIPAVNGERIAIRVVASIDSGTGAYTVTFQTAPDIWVGAGPEWNTIGSDSGSLSGTAFFNGTSPLSIGASHAGGSPAAGRIIAARLYDDGTLVANPKFDEETTGTTSFADDQGNTWTLNGTATIEGNEDAWGNADTGQLWNEYVDNSTFPAARWWVEGGAGRLHNPQSSFSGYGRYIDVDLTDFEARYDLYMPDIAPLGNDEAEFYLFLRGTDSLFTGYNVQLLIESSTKEARLRIGTGTADTAYVDVGSWQAGQRWRVRARVVGTIIEARAWNTANPEPNTWHVVATSTNRASGTVGIVNFGLTNDEVNAVFDNVLVTQIPPVGAAVVAVTPIQDDVWLKSIAFPSLNQNLGCIQTTARTRRSRVGLFDIKGRHEILGIADVGSTETFTILFDTHSVEENTAVTGLLTFGAPLLLQSPPDADETGCGNIAAYPSGWFMPGDSTQVRPLLGKRVWEWQVPLTRVAAPAPQSILPAHMTWSVLWQMVNTWVEVWDEWATWAELWNASVAPAAMFNALSGGGSP